MYILTLSPFMILQTRASHLSAHDLRLFSTIYSGLVIKCHLRMYSSIEWFILYVSANNFSSREPKAQGKLL